jgi:hypothetical protein
MSFGKKYNIRKKNKMKTEMSMKNEEEPGTVQGKWKIKM